MPSKSELLSQVFLKDSKLIASLVEKSSIGEKDIVLEIGPGRGAITDELIKKAGKVIVIEKDPQLCEKLAKKYQGNPSLELHNADALRFPLPQSPYKVFANPPFAIEGQLVRRLIDDPQNPPLDTYLVMRRGVAERLVGVPQEGEFSVLHKPWFEPEIVHTFRRENFKPKPMVESSMLRFRKREQPLITPEEEDSYRLFIQEGFRGGGRLKQNLARVFSPDQLARLAQELRFKVDDMPSELDFQQWQGMFEFFLKEIPESQRRKFIAKTRR